MIEFNKISEDLFNKIRGRFSDVTIGDEAGTVTNEPSAARFFDFNYKGLGKVSVNISEDEGLTIIYSKDFINNEDELTKNEWFDFLKDLRTFSKKRLLNFSVRDINKTNLTKRDYKFLANRSGDDTMTESKLYGTARVSYQNVGEARIMIKHTENINQESATGRTQKVGAIYIESADGERFRYPYKHLSGARAMAQHVSEGGKPYDDFGKHITGLSEELAKLRKFKTYMGRSAVMAESLAGYMDVVKERITTVKKTVESLQKPAYYKEAVEGFETPVLEDVPADVRENWIDELTIKQFNEELADVFPYIYKLVSEATLAKELGPDDILGESDEQLDEIAPLVYAGIMAAARAAVPALTRMGASIIAKRGAAATAAKGAAKFAIKNPVKTGVAGVAAANPDATMDVINTGKDIAQGVGNTIDAVQGAAQSAQDTMSGLATSAEEVIAKASNGIDAIKDEISAAVGSSGLLKVASFAKQYALPALAVVAILYGGKKVIDWLMGKGKEPQVEELEEKSPTDMDCWPNYKKQGTKPGTGKNKGKRVNNCVPEEIALEQGFEEMMGIFGEGAMKDQIIDAMEKIAADDSGDLLYKALSKGAMGPNVQNYLQDMYDDVAIEYGLHPDDDHDDIEERMWDQIQQDYGMGESVDGGPTISQMSDDDLADYLGVDVEEVKADREAAEEAANEKSMDHAEADDTIDVKMTPDGGIEKADAEDDKTPLGEFILSYYDRETGKFPKGETAVLTMVEKDYGEQFIEPAKAFIEQINALYDEHQMRTQPQHMEVDAEYDRMRELAGLR